VDDRTDRCPRVDAALVSATAIVTNHLRRDVIPAAVRSIDASWHLPELAEVEALAAGWDIAQNAEVESSTGN
jgi:hypothetical protein